MYVAAAVLSLRCFALILHGRLERGGRAVLDLDVRGGRELRHVGRVGHALRGFGVLRREVGLRFRVREALNDVVAELALDRLRDLAWLERRRRVGELRNHRAALEHAVVAVVLLHARIAAVLVGHLGEVRRRHLLANLVRLLADRILLGRRGRAGRALERDENVPRAEQSAGGLVVRGFACAESTLKVFCTESMKRWSFWMFRIGAMAASIAFLSLSESLCAAAYASCWKPVQMSATIVAVSLVHGHLDLGVAEQVAEPIHGQLLRAGASDDVDVRGQRLFEAVTRRDQETAGRDANEKTRAHKPDEKEGMKRQKTSDDQAAKRADEAVEHRGTTEARQFQ